MSVEVVVTGMGVVTSAGVGKKCFWDTVSNGRSSFAPIRRFDTEGFRCRIGAQISDELDPGEVKTSRKLWDLTACAGLIAAREALADAEVDIEGSPLGLFWGSAVGGIISLDEQFQNFYSRGHRWVTPATVPKTMLAAAAGLIAIETGARGPSCTFASACSASSHALAHAFAQIRSGTLKRCLVGGADCPISPGHLQAWDQLRALSPDNHPPGRACRPFSRNRNGLVLGEAAVAFVLERGDDAEKRGIEPYGRIRSYGANCDAVGVLQPSASSQRECIELALCSAGWQGTVPDYIAAHGTGTLEGDRSEVAALRSLFGEMSDRLTLSSIKSTLGHTLGASGALSLGSVLLAMREGIVPPTANYEEFDPDCDIDCVPNQARAARIEKALVHSFAFGGSNVVIAVEKP